MRKRIRRTEIPADRFGIFAGAQSCAIDSLVRGADNVDVDDDVNSNDGNSTTPTVRINLLYPEE